jgi:hypothetical protein
MRTYWFVHENGNMVVRLEPKPGDSFILGRGIQGLEARAAFCRLPLVRPRHGLGRGRRCHWSTGR